jgi:hypothetical protein
MHGDHAFAGSSFLPVIACGSLFGKGRQGQRRMPKASVEVGEVRRKGTGNGQEGKTNDKKAQDCA